MKVLVFCDYYLPGYKAGGPIRSLSNLVHHLGDEFEFHIVTRDRDMGENCSYHDIVHNSWQKTLGANIFYLSPDKTTINIIKNIIQSNNYDLIYLNSFFSPSFTIIPLLLRKLGFTNNTPVLIAPRGEFSSGALEISNSKKTIFIFASKIIRLYNNLSWHASTAFEQADINSILGSSVQVFVAPNLPSTITNIKNEPITPPCQALILRVAFLARIAPNKNLVTALQLLTKAKTKIEFNIFGPIEDINYWQQCEQVMADLPQNVQVFYRGDISHDKVIPTLSTQHLFFLPTKGENFGHVILEALLAGCPILISDRTPWRDLKRKRIGWDLSLDDTDSFLQVLESFHTMNEFTYHELRANAYNYALDFINNKDNINKNKSLFLNSI